MLPLEMCVDVLHRIELLLTKSTSEEIVFGLFEEVMNFFGVVDVRNYIQNKRES